MSCAAVGCRQRPAGAVGDHAGGGEEVLHHGVGQRQPDDGAGDPGLAQRVGRRGEQPRPVPGVLVRGVDREHDDLPDVPAEVRVGGRRHGDEADDGAAGGGDEDGVPGRRRVRDRAGPDLARGPPRPSRPGARIAPKAWRQARDCTAADGGGVAGPRGPDGGIGGGGPQDVAGARHDASVLHRLSVPLGRVASMTDTDTRGVETAAGRPGGHLPLRRQRGARARERPGRRRAVRRPGVDAGRAEPGPARRRPAAVQGPDQLLDAGPARQSRSSTTR